VITPHGELSSRGDDVGIILTKQMYAKKKNKYLRQTKDHERCIHERAGENKMRCRRMERYM
jgi:hypothetical protein